MAKPSLVVLVNELEVMNSLHEDSIKLIHATNQIKAIKKVMEVQDIVQLNLDIQREFGGLNDIVWDIGALSVLKNKRHEIIVYHSRDFNPPILLSGFVNKIQSLLFTAQHRLQTTI